MKYKLLRLSLLSMLAMFFGGLGSTASAADKWVKTDATELATGDVVVIVDQTSATAMSNNNGTSAAPTATSVTLSDDKSEISGEVTETLQWVVTVTNGSYQFNVAGTENYVYCTNTNNGVRVGTNENNAFTITQGGDNNADYLVNTATSRYIGVYNSQDWRCYTSINANIKATVTAFYKKTEGEADTRTATTVTLGEYATTGEVGGTIALPTAAVVAGETEIEGAAVTWTSSNEEVATIGEGVINLLKAGTTTVKASFAGDDDYKASSASFTLTVTAAPYTSLKALQDDVTSTSTPVTVVFSNVYVNAVKSSNAYLADAEGYGVLLYKSNHGLEAGQVLNGTATAKLVLYRGQTELTDLDIEALTITEGALEPAVKTIDQITTANQSTLVTLKDVTFSDGKLSDGTNEIAYYDNFSAGSLEEGATYDLTGIVILYNTTLEIAPRTADDIVKTSEVEQPVDERLDLTLSFPQESYEATIGEAFTQPELTGKPDDYDGMLTYSSSNGEVATVTLEGEVTLVAPGTVTITAEAMSSEKYKDASASYTLVVKEAETPVNPEDLTYTKVTSEAQLVDGGEYLIVYEAGNVAFNGAAETLDAVSNTVAVTISDGKIAKTDAVDAATFTLATNEDGAWTVKAANGLYIGVSSNSNGLKTSEDAATYTHNISFDEDGNVVIAAIFEGSEMTLRFNKASDQQRFRYYKSGQQAIQLYLKDTAEQPVEEGYVYRDFAVQLTNADIFATDVMNFGVKVAEDGSYTATAADDETANFTVSAASYNGSQHGWVNCTFTVPVQGAVKIELGDCQYGSQNGTITDAAGNVTDIKANATKKCWSANAPHENVVVAYYAGTEPTTLTIKYTGYCPFIAVTAIDPSEIPSEATVTFSIDGVVCEGVAPAAQKVEIGATVTIPANTTLYKEDFTLTAWTDGTAEYAAGQQVTVSEDITLTPVFTENAAAFADRTAETTITWQFGEGNGAGTLNAQGKSTILVAQATIGESVIDVKMDIDATNGKINNVGRGDKWAQCNDGTVLTIPAYKGTAVSFDSYSDGTGTTIGGVEATDKAATYEGTAETLDIVAKGIGYIASVTAVYPVPAADEEKFVDIKADFTNGSFFTAEETSVTTAGLKMNEDGTFTRVAADDETANAIITGKYHSNEHGLANFSATVKVLGTVKISMGTCAWGGDVTVKNAEGETVATFNTNTGACYHNDKENNIVSGYYKVNEPTTLTISGGSYTPYFAVEAVSPEQIPNDVKFIYDIANAGAEGIAPADETIAIGKEYTLPKNFTLYKEGMTLTGWTDGTATYAPGETITAPEADEVTLIPVFTENEVSLADRTAAVTVKFNFRRDAGAPTVAYQNQTGIWVAQANINGTDIDVKADFDTNNGGKFANGNWNDWAQLNGGTTWTVPSCKGAIVSMEAYSEITTTTIDGQTDYTSGKTISYTIQNTADNIDVVIGDGSYYRYIQVVLPVSDKPFEPQTFDNVAANIIWNLNDISEYATPNTLEPEGGYSLATVNLGGDTPNGVEAPSAGANSGIKLLKLNGGTTLAEFIVKPYRGLTFTPATVYAKIARYGTDGGTLNVSVKNAEGQEVSLATGLIPARNNKDQASDAKGSDANYATEFSFEVPAELATTESFTLVVTQSGLAENKQWGIGDVHITGTIDGETEDVAKYTVAAVANPEEGGSVNIYPQGDTFDDGTELKLTATEKFGYDFVNWTDQDGEVVSEEPVFIYTLTSDAVLTANFEAVETYELALTVDGTNDYMVTISPAPTVVDGKNMYEAGQAVQLTANQYEGLVTFTNWSDGETNSSKLVSMNGDVDLTAYYAEADIIAGWDFYKAGSSGRKADFAAQDNDGDALNLVNTESGETSGWLDKSTLGGGGYESFAGAAVNWRTGTKNGDVGNWHWQTKVNAAAFQDINVQFQMLYNYNAYQTYDAEYSLDGESWTKFGSITMTGAKAAASFSEQLPEAANNQAELYIRMLADKTSSVDGTASKNDGNTLAMFFITGTPQLVDDGTAPVLVSSVPADGAEGASASGKIVLTFDERVKVADGATATLGTIELTPVVSGKTVTFAYKGLEYSTQYTFTLPANSVADLTDNFIAEPITIGFTTMVRPSVEKGLYDYVVEDVDGLMAAISASEARADKNVRYRIFIKNGEYTIPLSSTIKTVNGYEVPECITFLKASNVSFIGESRDGVIITNGIEKSATFDGTYGKTSKYDGIGNSDVFQIQSSVSGLYWQDLTVETGMDDATGRDLAIQDKGTKNVYKNVGLRGFQDTWTSNNDNGLYYFEDGYVRGRTDYMCGKGDIFWNRVELRQIAGGYAAVPSKPKQYGWIYKDCTINGEAAVVNAATGETRTAAQVDGNYTLGRPWGSGTPIALFIDTKMNVVPSAIGWNEMSNGWPARFAEYNSMTSTGTVIDLSGRKNTFGDGHENNPVLTAEEALENSDLHRMYGDWDPTLLTEQAPVPANVKLYQDTKELTWDSSDYALLWAIVKDGKVIDFTIEPKYTVDDVTASYAVRAANEMGGLSEASVTAAITTAISEVANGEQAVPETIYNINGVRVQKAQKGLYIINGKKVVKN